MHFQVIADWGLAARAGSCRMMADRKARTCGNGGREMRVVLSTWGSRGDVEPLAGLAVRLRELGAEVQVCAPPDEEFATLLARAGVPLVPMGPTVRSVVAGPKGRRRRRVPARR